jgi:hypothetical protein
LDALGNHAFLPLEQCGFVQRHQQWIDVEAGNINHLGCKQALSISSVSYINKHRDHRLFEKFFYEVIDHLVEKTVKVTPARRRKLTPYLGSKMKS